MATAPAEYLLPTTPEQAPDPSRFPMGRNLRDAYELRMRAFEAPISARLAGDGEKANVTDQCETEDEVWSTRFDLVQLEAQYAWQALNSASNTSWWNGLASTLRQHGVESEQAWNLHLNSRHTATILVDGQKTTQGFEVFEFGETEQDQETLDIVFHTLHLIDQFSGGLLSADPRRPRIALMDGFRMADNRGGGETLGTATDQLIVLNMSAIAETAQEMGASRQELLAVVITHEILGHTLERLVSGKIGSYFGDYFDYSDERVPGEIFNSVHAQVTAKQAAGRSSAPVREYGSIHPAEDVATTIDAMISETMGWTKTTDKSPRHRSVVDIYRQDLVTQLMIRAAQQATRYDGTPGFVGSEVRADIDQQGKTIIRPVRTMEIETTLGEQAVADELQKVISKHKPPKEFIVQRIVSPY